MDDSFVLSLDDLRAITLGNFKNSHAENKEHFLKMKEVMKLWYVITFHLYLLKMTFSARHARNILHPLWIRYCLKVGMSSVMVIYCQCRARIISFCYAAELPQNSGIY